MATVPQNLRFKPGKEEISPDFEPQLGANFQEIILWVAILDLSVQLLLHDSLKTEIRG